MSLNTQHKRALRARGHALKPVVSIGSAGLTEAVLREINLSLTHHELMKVKITGADRVQRAKLIETLCEKLGAELIQSIGQVALIYRPDTD